MKVYLVIESTWNGTNAYTDECTEVYLDRSKAEESSNLFNSGEYNKKEGNSSYVQEMEVIES